MPTRGSSGAQPRRTSRPASTASASSRSSGRVTLKASSAPGTTTTRPPRRSTSPASSVASPASGPPYADSRTVAPEALRGLHGAQRRPVDGRHHRAVGTDLLDGVDDREAGHHGVGAAPHRRDHRVDQRARHQRAGRVVHQHDLDRRREHGQRPAYRVAAGVTAVDDDQLGAVVRRGEHRAHLVGTSRRHGDHDEVDRPGREGAHRVGEHRLAAERVQGLGAADPEPLAAPGRRDDCGDDRVAHSRSARRAWRTPSARWPSSARW